MCLVSVIIPNYNHELFLQQRIDSVLGQTYQDYELIILDDKSTDNSREIIERYRSHPKVSAIVYNEQNSGSTFKQWEKGIAVAKGEYIWLAESDDTATDKFLETLIPLLEKNLSTGIAFCQSNKMNDKGVVTGTWLDDTANLENNIFKNDFVMNGRAFIKEHLIVLNRIPNASAVIFRKAIYQQVSGVKENIKTNSDWLLWLKMLMVSDIRYIATTLNNFRYHEKSVIAKIHNTGGDVSIHSFERILRTVFHNYIQPFVSGKNARIFKEIEQLNKYHLAVRYRSEAFFNFKLKNWGKGWGYVWKATYHSRNLKHVKATVINLFASGNSVIKSAQ